MKREEPQHPAMGIAAANQRHVESLLAERDNALHRAGRLSEELRNTTQKLRAEEDSYNALYHARAKEATKHRMMLRDAAKERDTLREKLRAAEEALERIAEFGNDLRQPSPQRIARTALDSETKGAPAIHGHTFTACGPDCATQQEGENRGDTDE